MSQRWASNSPIRIAVAVLALVVVLVWPAVTGSGRASEGQGGGPSVVAPIYPPYPGPVETSTGPAGASGQSRSLLDQVTDGARAAWNRVTGGSGS